MILYFRISERIRRYLKSWPALIVPSPAIIIVPSFAPITPHAGMFERFSPLPVTLLCLIVRGGRIKCARGKIINISKNGGGIFRAFFRKICNLTPPCTIRHKRVTDLLINYPLMYLATCREIHLFVLLLHFELFH